MKAEDLEFLFNFPIDRVDMECRAKDKYCDGKDDSGRLIVLRALLPLSDGHTAEAVLCAKHMEDCVEAITRLMEDGVAQARREDGFR